MLVEFVHDEFFHTSLVTIPRTIPSQPCLFVPFNASGIFRDRCRCPQIVIRFGLDFIEQIPVEAALPMNTPSGLQSAA
jgi:hypothetical protein